MKKKIKIKGKQFENNRFAVVLTDDLAEWIKKQASKKNLPAAALIRLKLTEIKECEDGQI